MTDFTQAPPKPSAGRLREKVIGALYQYARDAKAEISTLQSQLDATRLASVSAAAAAESAKDELHKEILSLTAEVARLSSVPPPVVTHADEFFDALGHVWWRENGIAFRDGAATPSAEVVKLASVAGVARQTNAQGNSWDWSESVKQWVRVQVAEAPPPVINPPATGVSVRGYGPHLMLCFIPQDPAAGKAQAIADIRFAKAQGQTFLFAFSDPPFSNAFNNEGDMYGRRLSIVLEVAAAEGMAVVPQMQHASPEAVAHAFTTFLDHPAILKHNGKPVFAFWNWKPTTDQSVAFARQKYGKPVEVWTCFDWWELMQPLHDDQVTWNLLPELFKAHPQIDGVLNFVVGGNFDHADPRKVDKIIEQNRNLVKFCRAAGKTSIAGWAARYHTSIMTDANILRVLDAAIQDKPDFLTLSTANDWGESGINRAADQHWHDLVRPKVDAFLKLP